MKKQLLYTMAFLLGTAAVAQTGGPDAWGYSYANSNATGGPSFNWIELDTTLGGSGTYASIASTEDDSHQANILMSFDFPFYGRAYDSVSIGTNGTVYFQDTYLGLGYACMPGDPGYDMPDDMAYIALWHTDLNPGSGGNIFYQDFETHFVIEFSGVVEYGASDGDTYEVILYPNGEILMQYKETSAIAIMTTYSIGIQGSPTVGLSYYCDGAGDAIADSLAILWTELSIGFNESTTSELSIYPNPNNGEFNLAITSSSNDLLVEVTDVQGRVIYTKQYHTNTIKETISLYGVAAGIYYVTANNGLTVATERLIIK